MINEDVVSIKAFEDLADETLLFVFSFINADEILRTVVNVCQRWRNIGTDESLWKRRKEVFDDDGFTSSENITKSAN